MARNVVAIDGGGTSTIAAMADQAGKVTVLDPATGCNPQDAPNWEKALTFVLDQISAHSCVVLGMPGYGELPGIDLQVVRLVRSYPFETVEIMNDVTLASRGAFPNGGGVLLLSGTGSMAMVHHNGATHRVGGWGHNFGDEGSAHWIGRCALSRASFELDGRMADTGFAHRLTDALNSAQHPFGLIEWVLDVPTTRTRIAECARHVDALCEIGDPVAAAILDEAAILLGDLAKAAASKADLGTSFAWCPAGSVFHSNQVLAGVTAQFGAPIHAPLPTLGGGLVRAAELASWDIDETWLQSVKQALYTSPNSKDLK